MSVPSPSSLEYELTGADVDAFATYHVGHDAHLAKRITRMRWVWAVVFAVIGFEYARTSKLGGLAFAGIAIAYLAIYGPMNRYLFRRQMGGGMHRGPAPGIGRVTLRLTSDGLVVDGSNGTTRLEASAIRRIEAAPAYYFLYVGPLAAIIVPRTGVSRGDPDAFVRALQAMTPSA